MTQKNKNNFIAIYLVVFFALLMSKGLALVPALGLDDYVAIHQDRNVTFYLWQGRFTQALIQVLLTNLGVSPTAIAWPVIFLFFAFAAWAITLGVIYVANNRGSTFGLAAIGAIMASHPYLTEYFTFRESLVTQGSAFALIAFIFNIYLRTPPDDKLDRFSSYALIILLMVFLAGAQQTAFIVLGYFILAGLMVRIMERRGNFVVTRNDRVYDLLVLYLVSAFFYVILYGLIRGLTDAPMDQRSSVIPMGGIPERIGQVGLLTKKLLFSGEPTLSLAVKFYSFGVFLFLLIFVAFSNVKKAVLITITAILFYFGGIFLVSISGVWWPVPRAVYAIGFALGVLLILAFVNSPKKIIRLFPYAGFLAAVGMSFHSSALLYDQIRLNRWDSWVASEIANQLLRIDIDGNAQIVLVGAPWGHPIGLKTIDGDLNVSALAVPWAANHLFMETTGRKWNIGSVASSPVCDGVHLWPNKESIVMENSKVYVCLGKSR